MAGNYVCFRALYKETVGNFAEFVSISTPEQTSAKQLLL